MENPKLLLAQHHALLTGRWITDLANTSAFLFAALPRVNWVGFYLLEEGKLWLGPFQGKAACTEITLDRGVCGAAASRRETLLVDDVHEFPGHISCDPISRSEIVVPLLSHGELLGVLDVDSPEIGRFGQTEKELLEAVAEQLLAMQKNT